ncbi:MAG: cereblon family protein [Myxococcota bacterium]
MQPPALELKTHKPATSREREPGHSAQTEEREEKPILCRRCGAEISDSEALFSMGGERISRVFSNPNGMLHEIITVGRARGLRLEGPPTTDFSWFPGYAWEIAFCEACESHLGWQFTAAEAGAEPSLFFGLRRSEIVEP